VKVEFSPAFILHQRPYRETSLLVDVFSQQFGRQSLIAKGIRKTKRSQQGIMQLYQPLLLSWSGYGDLHTLTAVEAASARYVLKNNASLCGLYINELLIRFLAVAQPESEIYHAYELALDGLQQQADDEVVLRLFEKRLLLQLGYGLVLDKESETGLPIEATARYLYQANKGLKQCLKADNRATISGRSLQHLIDETGFDQTSLQEIKQLMRSVLNYYLDGRPLQSRQLFAEMQKYASKP